MLDQLVKELVTKIRSVAGDNEQPADLSASNLKAVIEAALSKFNLVTREEFDAQAAVLARTREKLEALEAQLVELEKEADASSPKAK